MVSEAAKAYVALAGAVATALLGVFTADTAVGKVLTVVAVIATAVVTFVVPNAATATVHRKMHRDQGGAISLEHIVAVAVGVFVGGLLLWLLIQAIR